MIYFDNAASTKCYPLVIKKMLPFFDQYYANPSAYHGCGREARDAIETARYQTASYLGCIPTEIIFTSGATEANNLAIKSCALLCKKDKPYNIIMSEIEHKSVLAIKEWLKCEDYETRMIKTDPSGIIDFEYLQDIIDENTLLVSCMYINNETGIIQPVNEIGKLCKDRGVLFHCDATQAFGKYEINILDLGADLLSASAHKLHGPKGCGVLYKNKDLEFKCLLDGGSQEDGRRAGTENVPGIVGFGEALRIARIKLENTFERMLELERLFLKKMQKEGIYYTINGNLNYKSPWIFNLNFGIDSDELMDLLPEFCFSKSSACSKNFTPSHVLDAMSIDEEIIKNSIRISFSSETTEQEIDLFVSKIKNLQNEKEI